MTGSAHGAGSGGNGARALLCAARAVRVSSALLTLCALTLSLSCSRDRKKLVVVYSPHGAAVLRAFEKRFETAHPEYDMQYLDLSSQAVLDRLRSESPSPQADVWWGAGAPTFASAADEGLLEDYTPTWAAGVSGEARDESARWFGIYETPEVIVFNSKLVTAAEAPADWDDLLDEKWRGKLIVRTPVESDTMRTVFGAMILNRWDRSNGPDAGYDWLRGFARNTKDYSPGWDAMLASLNRQEAAVTVWNMPDVVRAVNEKGYSLSTVVPKSGSPVLIDGIAIVKGAPNGEGARAFYEFVSSPESLAYAASAFYRIPVRKDLPPDSLPEWLRTSHVERMPVDWTRYRAGIKEWMTYWGAEIRGAGGG